MSHPTGSSKNAPIYSTACNPFSIIAESFMMSRLAPNLVLLLIPLWFTSLACLAKKFRRFRLRCLGLLASSHLVIILLHVLRCPRVGRRASLMAAVFLLVSSLTYNLFQPSQTTRLRTAWTVGTRPKTPGQRCWLLMLRRAVTDLDPKRWAKGSSRCKRRPRLPQLLRHPSEWRALVRMLHRQRGRILCPRYPPPRRPTRRPCPGK